MALLCMSAVMEMVSLNIQEVGCYTAVSKSDTFSLRSVKEVKRGHTENKCQDVGACRYGKLE